MYSTDPIYESIQYYLHDRICNKIAQFQMLINIVILLIDAN